MSDFSNFSETQIGEILLNGNASPFDGDLFIALFETDPQDDASGLELVGNGYARAAIDSSVTDRWDEGIPTGTFTNNVNVTFPQAVGGDWNTVSFWAAFDAITGGNMIVKGTLIGSITVLDTETRQFGIGDLRFQVL